MRQNNCEDFWKEVGVEMKRPDDCWKFVDNRLPDSWKAGKDMNEEGKSFNDDTGCIDAT